MIFVSCKRVSKTELPKSDSLKYGRLQITLNSETLNFFTHQLGYFGKSLFVYCNTNKNIMPKNEKHIYVFKLLN